jgi:hypothetical protein
MQTPTVSRRSDTAELATAGRTVGEAVMPTSPSPQADSKSNSVPEPA